jgi:hypothetical protein
MHKNNYDAFYEIFMNHYITEFHSKTFYLQLIKKNRYVHYKINIFWRVCNI